MVHFNFDIIVPLKRTKERANPFVMTPEERQKLTLADYEAYLKYLLSWKRFDVDLRPKEILEIVLNEKYAFPLYLVFSLW